VLEEVGIRCARMSDRIGEHHARPADSAGLSCLRRHTPELATHRRLMPVVADDLIPAPVGNDPYERGHRRLVQPPGSAEAGWQLCERVVDSELPRGGDFLGRDPFGKGDLGGSVGARGSVFLVDGSQAFLGEAVRDTNESWP